jgi:hypothetical protein
VIDPVRRRVTHLVVQPHRRHWLARLVPVDLVDADAAGPGIALRASVEEVRRLEPVQEFAYLHLGDQVVEDPEWDVGVESVLALPYYDASGLGLGGYALDDDPHVGVVYDRIPAGEVEIRRSSAVRSADGHHLGHVDGFLVGADDAVTHVVLERGHLWGRRDVTIPIAAVASVEVDTVTLGLSKDAVAELPATPVHRWPGSTAARRDRG